MKISEEIRKSVAFACYRDLNGEIRYAGTVFFVSSPIDEQLGLAYIVTVTALHVILKIKEKSVDQKVLLQMNLLDGGSHAEETNVVDWKYHPDETYPTDVAVLAWSPSLEKYDWRCVATSLAVTDEMINQEVIAHGNEVFIVGLFRNYFGRKKNQPIIRVGNIAMMPDEPIPTDTFANITGYLIESRSTGGLSGSPVFVTITSVNFHTKTYDQDIYWLGLIHGHYDVAFPEEDSLVGDGLGAEAINRGIAIVIPATKVLETLEHPEIVLAMEKERRELLNGSMSDGSHDGSV